VHSVAVVLGPVVLVVGVVEVFVGAVDVDEVEADGGVVSADVELERWLDPPHPATSKTAAIAVARTEARMWWCSAGGATILPRATIFAPAMQQEAPHHQYLAHDVRAALEKHDPFWAPQLIVALAILLDLALPNKLTLGPPWLLPALEGLLLVGLIVASPNPALRHSVLRRRIAIGLISLVSAVNAFSLILLCHYLLHGGKENGHALILAGVALWGTNVLLFGLWFWELNRGGPVARALKEDAIPDFLFQQMAEPRFAEPDWAPGLVDYLYTSLTNATAFSPTDTMPLTATAKWLMSAQSLIALTTVGPVVARAVNILS
jgi:hypothetical protein